MSKRATVTIILVIVLILVVMGVTGVLAASDGDAAKYTQQRRWSYSLANIQALKIIDLTGDGQDDLFVQGETALAVLDANGNTLLEQSFSTPLVTTLGQLDGSGAEEMIAAIAPAGLVQVTALRGDGTTLWQRRVDNMDGIARSATIRFDAGTQVVLGDENGQLVALSGTGEELWRAQLSSGDYIRGLDEVKINGQRNLAAANHDGTVALYDATGQELWDYRLGEDLRRMRVFDLDGDGNGEILIGGDISRLVNLRADGDGENLDVMLGQAITQIREAEINGDPASREFVVGGKDGGVWAYDTAGTQLWARSMSSRVQDITATDVDGDGTNEVIVGDESGNLVAFVGTSGTRMSIASYPASILRMDVGSLGASNQLVVADAQGANAVAVAHEVAPIWYNPLLAGGIISVFIAVLGWVVATLPPKPTLRASATDQSVEGLKAQRMMLHEAIADVERLRQSGQMPADAYLMRLKELRGQMADTEAALLKAGVKVQLETMKCPNCGATLSLGSDRCDYCGQVVLR